MDSNDLTTEQAATMHKSLFRLANYLSRIVKRMEKTGFPPSDPLYQSAKRAYDAVCSLYMDLQLSVVQNRRRQTTKRELIRRGSWENHPSRSGSS